MSESRARIFLGSVQLLFQLPAQHSYHFLPVFLAVFRFCQAFDGSAHEKELRRIPNSIHHIIPVVVEFFRNRGVLYKPDKSLTMILNKHEGQLLVSSLSIGG